MLADLDELILRCRDERARAYIKEAVTCCKAGAYRSAIVSTWIAVVFDVIDKIRELSLSADKEAESLIDSYDQMVAQNDFARALNFERTLLQVAKEKFELISELEYMDLERLRLDRHRCAHPSHISPAEIFSPPAELARVHIRSAVDYLLQHEPAQGKAALDGLMAMVTSQYFARDDDDALTVFNSSPLKRARPSLIRNFIVVLLKDSLRTETRDDQFWRNRRALRCVNALHPAAWNEVLSKDLNPLFRKIEEHLLGRAIRLLGFHPSLVEFLSRDQIVRLQQFIQQMQKDDDLDLLDDALDLSPLTEAATMRCRRLVAKEVAGLTMFTLPAPIRDHMVKLYVESGSFDEANAWGLAVKTHADSLTPNQVREVLNAAGNNVEIRESFRVGEVLDTLKRWRIIPDDEFESLRRKVIFCE